MLMSHNPTKKGIGILNFRTFTLFEGIYYASLVVSAGKSNSAVTTMMSRLSYAGKGVLVVALAVSVYNIATASNTLSAAGKELFSNGAGIGGGIAGGALAGLACGPGAPVCVTLGAFLGGALAAYSANAIC